MSEKTYRRDAIIGAVTGVVAGTVGAMKVAQAQTAPSQTQPNPQSPPAQTEAPPSFSQLTQPAEGVTMPPGYIRAMAQFAYIWGWPLINMVNRNAAITQAPHPGLLGGFVPVAPRGRIAMLSDYIKPQETFVTCPNQDVVYGLGFFSLDQEPVVIQVPDFGDRFWVYALYDNRTDQFGQLGKPYGRSQDSICLPARTGTATCLRGSRPSCVAQPRWPMRSRAFFSTTPPRTAKRFKPWSIRSLSTRWPNSMAR